MGTWGVGPFENDDAGDWLNELEDSRGSEAIEDVLDAVMEGAEEYLEAPDCAMALAAAEVVAALNGRPMGGLPDQAKAWVQAHKNIKVAPLLKRAGRVVELIADNSELKELWDESDHAAQWQASLEDLALRLKA